jgi:hypothetical protein
MGSSVATAILALVFAVAGVAQAQPAVDREGRVQQLAEEARARFGADDFAGALACFEEPTTLSGDDRLGIWIALTLEKLGRDPDGRNAQDLFGEFTDRRTQAEVTGLAAVAAGAAAIYPWITSSKPSPSRATVVTPAAIAGAVGFAVVGVR